MKRRQFAIKFNSEELTNVLDALMHLGAPDNSELRALHTRLVKLKESHIKLRTKRESLRKKTALAKKRLAAAKKRLAAAKKRRVKK